jgi:tetratricopeptide (TPR) repeat protein
MGQPVSHTASSPVLIGSIWLLLVLAVLLASACATAQSRIIDEPPATAEPAELAGIELDLVACRAALPMAVDLPDTVKRLETLIARPTSDAPYQARVLALSAEAALLAGDRKTAARRVSQARASHPGDELAAIVGARLASSATERLAIIEQALILADETCRLRAELGLVLLEIGRYREAVAAFDSALPFLPEEYAMLYASGKDRAWALRAAADSIAAGIRVLLTRDILPMAGMAIIAQNETAALVHITGDSEWAPGVLFERLKAAGYYSDPGTDLRDATTRRDAALFLWQLMARGDARLLFRYTVRYADAGTSPVPDVPYGARCFDAVLGVVEEDVMPLVDGRHFRPDEPVNGLDFYGWLHTAAAWR